MIGDVAGQFAVELGGMVGMDKMSEFVINHVFNAVDRCVDEGIVEGKDVFFEITASPTGSHMPEFDLGV